MASEASRVGAAGGVSGAGGADAAGGSASPGGDRTDGVLPTLSVSIVCRNNEDVIGRCVASVSGLAGEIVAVDSGSTDGTIGILESHGARVVHQEWLGFVKQKQFAMDRCAGAWVLHLDSDESLEPELADAVRRFVERDPHAKGRIGGGEVNRKVWWGAAAGGGFLHHAWQPEWRLRLVKREAARWAGYDPHDKLELTDATLRVEKLAGDMRHDSISSVTAFLAKQAEHSRVGALSYDAMGRRGSVSKLVTSPLGAWLKQMVFKSAWRDGWRGWTAAGVTACAAFMKHAALLELQRGKTKGRSSG